MIHDFKIEWCTVSDELPVDSKTPVLVYSERFSNGFAVCRYAVGYWIIDGLYENICRLKVSSKDYWAYLPEM
jgi:hypothetical protein